MLSAPSGAGKTTLAEALLDRFDDLERSISCTTRAPRPGEVDGVDYFFVDVAEFRRRRQAGEFLESAEVHGNLYGTLRSELDRIHASGADALMVIDVQGAESVRRELSKAVTIFVLPPSKSVLQRRLKERDGEVPERAEAARRRLGVAADEIERFRGYDYVVVNDDLAETVGELQCVVRAERARVERRVDRAEAILESFQQ